LHRFGDTDTVFPSRWTAKEIRETTGPIKLLVNNAAYTHLLTREQLNLKRWQRFLRSNVDGPFLMTWVAKEDMIAADIAAGGSQ
jgi:NAD(P)-dependent dehydrogenase (short-subunit alcohol dehydrogenase family)